MIDEPFDVTFAKWLDREIRCSYHCHWDSIGHEIQWGVPIGPTLQMVESQKIHTL